MYSMTGFGRGILQRDGREISVELKSVNHRFLDISFRMSRTLNFLEDSLRKYLQSEFARGHVDVYVSYKNDREDAKEAVLDKSVVAAYMEAAAELKHMGISGGLDIKSVMRLPDAVRISEKEDDAEAIEAMLMQAVSLAGDQLKDSRRREGERLKADITAHLLMIAEKRLEIAAREPLVVSDYKEKLTARLETLLDGVEIDETRIIQEVAIFADKASIAEELTRLQAHIETMLEDMQSSAPMGRRLDFIVQELNRETNTIGSKASDMQILALVVDIKAEIEKIREQVQNIQ